MTREQKQHILHFAVSSLGGFMGGYAIFNHCDVFGNAQTANMIHLVSKIFTGDFEGVVFIVIALLTYILGNVFFVIADRFIKLETKTVSLIASTVALLIIGIFPNISNNYLAILPILFVTPVLWNSFRTAGSYVTSPIFSTNNLRVATVSTFTGIIDKDKDMKKLSYRCCPCLRSERFYRCEQHLVRLCKHCPFNSFIYVALRCV